MRNLRVRELFCICMLAVLLASCALAPSRRLVRDPLTPPVQVAGWKIIPDICVFENVDGVDTSRWDFTVGLLTELPRAQLIDSTEPIAILRIDSLELLLKDATRLWLPLKIATWPSNRSHQEIARVHNFEYNGSRSVAIPPGTQSATARFVVRVQKAYHRYKDADRGIWRDDFIVDSTLPEETVQVTVPLVLREKAGANGPE